MNIRAIVVSAAAVLSSPALVTAQDSRVEAEFTKDFQPFVLVRGGASMSEQFEFEAVTTKGFREVRGTALMNVGAELGVILGDTWTVSSHVDAGLSSDVAMTVLGGSLGYLFTFDTMGFMGGDVKARISAGVLFGDVTIDQFSDFKHGLGGHAGIDFLMDAGSFTLDVFLDARMIEFELKEDFVSGDQEYGGGSLTAGVGVMLKF